MQKEIWKPIKDWEGLYSVSNKGKVFSIRSNKCLKGVPEGMGYLQVYLCKNGKCKRYVIHRIVAMHFIENPHNKPEVNHIDCIKSNNNVSNLEWVSPSENVRHSIKMGRVNRKGEKHPSNKLNEKQVMNIRGLLKDGKSVKEVNRLYPFVTRSCIWGIKGGHTWKHLIS